jgi:MFS family permease
VLTVHVRWINCVGVFQDYYMRAQLKQYSPSEVAWISSVEVFFMLATGPVAGFVFDNYGPTKLLIAGSFLHVFGLMMASISTEYYQFMLSQGVCSPIGACCIFTAAVSCVSTWFYKKRGMASGIVASGSSLGGVLFPIIVNRMINETGFPWAMRTCAFLILGLCIFATFTLRSRFPPTRRPWSIMAFLRPLQEVPMILLALATFFFYWGMFPIFSFVSAVGNGRGMSLELSQYLVSILNAGSVFGRTLPGILGDRLGRFTVMTVCCTFASILILAVWIPAKSNVGSLVFSPFFGFASGAAIGLTPALIAQVSPIKEIGVRTGTIFASGAVGALTGSPIGGQLITRDHGGFLYLQLFAGLVCFVGTAFFGAARIYLGGFDLRKKV